MPSRKSREANPIMAALPFSISASGLNGPSVSPDRRAKAGTCQSVQVRKKSISMMERVYASLKAKQSYLPVLGVQGTD